MVTVPAERATQAEPDPQPWPTEEQRLWTYVTGLLNGLGDTAAEVAWRLQAAGCQGYRHESERCPLSTYLARLTGRVCVVGTDSVHVYTTGAVGVHIRLPAGVAAFVDQFDAGRWTTLDRLPVHGQGWGQDDEVDR